MIPNHHIFKKLIYNKVTEGEFMTLKGGVDTVKELGCLLGVFLLLLFLYISLLIPEFFTVVMVILAVFNLVIGIRGRFELSLLRGI